MSASTIALSNATRAPHSGLLAEIGNAGTTQRSPSPSQLSAAALFDQPQHLTQLVALRSLATAIGAPLECAIIPASLARGGTVGRIGVPAEAGAMLRKHRVLLGATVGADPLLPVSRLWRGLQRRADVQVDVRQCTTLVGSAADRAGNQRDVLLLSQRVAEGAPRRRSGNGAGDPVAVLWTRARDAADLAIRLASAEQRRLLLVLPVGRGTEAQQFFTEALERQARLHRMQPPRVVKAGLLSALLSGDAGRERWLVASVIPIDELSALACEAVGDTGPWPVISIGRDVTFLDLPAEPSNEPVAMLLAFSTLLQRTGRGDLARTLVQSTLLTGSATMRMREELGGALDVPPDAFMQGVLANWGRVAPVVTPRDRRAPAQPPIPMVVGLRLRIESSLSAGAIRERVTDALVPAGLEVASVRSVDSAGDRDDSSRYDVRVRTRLGEPPLGDLAADAVREALGRTLRCLSVEPWVPGAAVERSARSQTPVS